MSEPIDVERLRRALEEADQKWDWGRDGHAVARARIQDFAADIAAAYDIASEPEPAA